MITMFNSKTVYLGTDLKKFNEIRDDLDANQPVNIRMGEII